MDSSHKGPGPYEYFRESLMEKWGEAIILNVVDMYGPGHVSWTWTDGVKAKGDPQLLRNQPPNLSLA